VNAGPGRPLSGYALGVEGAAGLALVAGNTLKSIVSTDLTIVSPVVRTEVGPV